MASLSRIILGTAKFGMQYGTLNQTQVPLEEVRIIPSRAFELCISRFDTANSYGVAESLIGSANISSILVISKIASEKYQKCDIAHQFCMSVRDSLIKLNIGK